MRTSSIALFILLTSLCTGTFASSFPEGGTGGTDAKADSAANSNIEKVAIGVQISRIRLSAADVNPDYNKVTRWDTNDINMYHVDMAVFKDTLTYIFDRPADGHRYCIPRNGRVTSGFGHRSLFGRKFHKGLDIDLETGDEVKAAIKGKVRIARYSNGYGNFVVISHDGGLETLYGHMSELTVSEGQDVFAGQIIGLGGSTGQSTGSHLHFEVRVFGEQIDPALILDTETLMPRAHEIKIDASWFNHLAKKELPENEVVLHTVADGETLEEICLKYEIKKATLLEINHIEETLELAEGMILRFE